MKNSVEKLEIRNIFFDNVEELFDSLLAKAGKEIGLDNNSLLEKLGDKFPELVEEFNELMVNFYFENNTFSLDNFLETHHSNQKTIVKSNGKSFALFLTYVNACHIIYNKTCEDIEKKSVSENIKICITIYGLIIRKAGQIGSNLIDGYVDSAMIIWRSLYENSIALITLLEEDDDNLAKRFMDHSLRNTKKKAESYKKNHEELGFKPVSSKVYQNIDAEEERIKELYGKEFIKNEFGWANHLIPGKQKASLYLLEERLKLNRYRPYYLLCCEQTHLGFNAFNNYKENEGVILPRVIAQTTESKSFIDPMQFTISLLHQASDLLLANVSVAHEYIINVKLLKRISTDFINTLSNDNIEEEE